MRAASDDDDSFAARIVSMHGGRADALLALRGAVNRVIRVTGPGNDWVVRYPLDSRRSDEYPVEVWAAGKASLHEIATADIVAAGHLDDRPYLIVQYVESQPDQDENQYQAWGWLGRYAALVATIPLDDAPEAIFSRFGRDLPLAWRAHLSYNYYALSEDDALAKDGVYRTEDRSHLRALVERLRSTDFTFGLAHGDLAPRNLIPRCAPSPPVLLDWGTATTGPAPWTDLQRVYAWTVYDRTVSEPALAQFADAAGLPFTGQVRAVLEQMSAVRFLDLARWARERRPDLYDEYRQSSQQGLRTILGVV